MAFSKYMCIFMKIHNCTRPANPRSGSCTMEDYSIKTQSLIRAKTDSVRYLLFSRNLFLFLLAAPA